MFLGHYTYISRSQLYSNFLHPYISRVICSDINTKCFYIVYNAGNVFSTTSWILTFFSFGLFPADVFFSISLALMVASLLETVFITNIQYSSTQFGAVPHWLNVFVLRYLALLVCLPRQKTEGPVTVFLHGSNGILSLLLLLQTNVIYFLIFPSA